MPKMKTHKATAKRYKLTKKGKIIKRTAGQNHFNARENGNTGRNKKSDVIASTTLNRVMKTNLPN
ncbi:MAG: 50S ribosomal protein L35 [Candidatus Magasanikbacteria bacterium RIFOXYD2_FULL_39_9]|uniref:Large ribosomal subunit protein bL35 n=1 Tax=Candidatus Magasanikbacteria bacterium RIFOXYD1_FULL_40_23 TaxID=1798705 RepID=A0A1F6PB41_9BACT|nr:MAG: 50S ribosomal protein L35 [Candidatus Magasanikbacteria bacterium RIFOXYD2_FULL_39_9]OGH93385.1 MAG: 50S ribosomal protein L35 [Candidatus Magasanikbacteria bacterium RIFOXYD1_FULL_40_23]